MEHLLAGQRRLDRSLKLARCDRFQNGIGIHPQLAAETAANERAHEPDILDRNFQCPGDRAPPLIEHLV
jgi:hypothetical protein